MKQPETSAGSAEENHACAACGMSVKPRAYHPYAACLMFRACQDGNVVDANLDAIVKHGGDRSEETQLLRAVAEAASDYKFGKGEKQFAKLNGGMRKLQKDLLDAVDQWESHIDSLAKDQP